MALLLSAGVSPSARRPSFLKNQVYSSLSGFKLLSFSSPKTRLQLVQFQQSPMRLHVSCSHYSLAMQFISLHGAEIKRGSTSMFIRYLNVFNLASWDEHHNEDHEPQKQQCSCQAKPQTVEMVCEIVKKKLALPEDSSVNGQSTFSALGADSLDTVEIVMGLEEAFDITVEEENAYKITTVQDAADLIEKLVEAKTT